MFTNHFSLRCAGFTLLLKSVLALIIWVNFTVCCTFMWHCHLEVHCWMHHEICNSYLANKTESVREIKSFYFNNFISIKHNLVVFLQTKLYCYYSEWLVCLSTKQISKPWCNGCLLPLKELKPTSDTTLLQHSNTKASIITELVMYCCSTSKNIFGHLQLNRSVLL